MAQLIKQSPIGFFILSAGLLSSLALSDDCGSALSRLKRFEDHPERSGIVQPHPFLQEAAPVDLGSSENRHHPDHLSASLPENPRLVARGSPFLTEGKNTSPASWSRDGFVTIGNADGNLYLFKLDPKKQRLILVDKFDTGGLIGVPAAWGPQGIVAVATRSKGLSLLKLNARTQKLELVDKFELKDKDEKLVSSPAWGPDGTLAFGSGKNLHVLRFNTKTNKLEPLDTFSTRGSFARVTSWGPDGTMVAISDQASPISLLKLNPITNKLELKDEFKEGRYGFTSTPVWGPEGYFVSGTHEGHLMVLKTNPQTGKIEVVDQFKWAGKNHSAGHAWRPDGLLAVTSGESLQVLRFNPETKKLELIAESGIQNRRDPGEDNFGVEPSWGPGGTLAINSFHDFYVYRLHPKTKQLELLKQLETDYIEGGRGASWGPGGNFVMGDNHKVKLFGLSDSWVNELRNWFGPNKEKEEKAEEKPVEPFFKKETETGPSLGTPGAWSDLLKTEKERVRQ